MTGLREKADFSRLAAIACSEALRVRSSRICAYTGITVLVIISISTMNGCACHSGVSWYTINNASNASAVAIAR